mgnify:CR=1 FL=1
MADTIHSESPPATHQPLSSIAIQLLQLQANSDSPATQLALSNIAMQLLQHQAHYSEQADQQEQISALEAKSKLQAREISTLSSLISSLLSELHVVRSKQEERSPLSEPAEAKPVPNNSPFERLPFAIRQRIWRYTFHGPQIVQLFKTEGILPYRLSTEIPVAMHICNDSRREACSVFRKIGASQFSGTFDFEHDTLYISIAAMYYPLTDLMAALSRWFELEDIRRIAIHYELWKLMSKNGETFSRFLERLKGLEELIIVLDDDIPATPFGRKRQVAFVHCGNSVREVIVGDVSRTLIGIGKESLLSKIRYRKAVREPGHGSYLAQQLPSPGSLLELDSSEQAAIPALLTSTSESPTPQLEDRIEYPQPSPPTAQEAYEIGLDAKCPGM